MDKQKRSNRYEFAKENIVKPINEIARERSNIGFLPFLSDAHSNNGEKTGAPTNFSLVFSNIS
jgi:hypothetical protein